jgi:serine protease Do
MHHRSCLIAAPVCFQILILLPLATLTSDVGGTELRRTATVRAVEHARPSVVNIHGQKTVAPTEENTRRGDAPQHVNGMGTGVVIDPRGYIITNYHVVEGVKKIQVTLAGGQPYTAVLVSHDPRTDLAVIKISAKEPMPVISIGTSSDLMSGEPVIAVGNAYGYEHTVTRGIISALHRTVQVSDAQQYRDLIQTDASINPGNSGGPLLNIDGEMIGINVAVRAGAQGIGFAIPVDMAMNIAAMLMSVERIDNNYHGVHATNETVSRREFIVGEVDEESPAAKGGLRPGDVITQVDDKPVARALDFERALIDRKAGEEVPVTVDRNHQPVTLTLVLAAKVRTAPADQTWEQLGLKLEPVASKQFRQVQSRYHGGLLVQSVKPDSPAARQGIRRGDILVGMHIWETVSLENVAYILNRPDFADLEPLKFYILRNNEPLFGHLSVSMRK